MNEYKDNDLREALRRKEARRKKPVVHADFCNNIMQEIAPRPIARTYYRQIAAAACLLFIIGMGLTLVRKENYTVPQTLVAENKAQTLPAKLEEARVAQPLPTPQGEGCPKGGVGSVSSTQQILQTPPLTPPLEGRGAAGRSPSPLHSEHSTPKGETKEQRTDPNLHYVSHEATEDTAHYQDPSRVDDFIAKLAGYYGVKQGELQCSARMDSDVVSAVYVFPDKGTMNTRREEVDIFARLLQVACWYSDETPGYFLNFSHRQFFFELKDLRRQLHYRWIAERVNGKILLYGTHAPIGTKESSACYQEYRDELMHANSIKTNKTREI